MLDSSRCGGFRINDSPRLFTGCRDFLGGNSCRSGAFRINDFFSWCHFNLFHAPVSLCDSDAVLGDGVGLYATGEVASMIGWYICGSFRISGPLLFNPSSWVFVVETLSVGERYDATIHNRMIHCRCSVFRNDAMNLKFYCGLALNILCW